MRCRGIALLICVATLTGCSPAGEEPAAPATDTLRTELGGPAHPDFARASGRRDFEFPRDHGPHPAYRNEWWYITGNVEDTGGARLGFHVTFFRIALTPGAEERDSAWASRQVWMAHLALTDVDNARHLQAERFARGGDIGLAGAGGEPLRVWLEDWQLRREDGDWLLDARADGFALKLRLQPRKPPVLHGDEGLSRKSAEPGNASWYYSKTRLATTGRIRIDDDVRAVDGSAWLDREWSTSVLGEDQVGWDWFALQLDDGTDLMIYAMRRADGRRSPYSYAAMIDAGGAVTRLAPAGFRVDVTDEWISPRGGTYPARWEIDADPLDRRIEVVPVMADQEFIGTVRYWEGAVDVLADGEPVGRGYVELTGYGR